MVLRGAGVAAAVVAVLAAVVWGGFFLQHWARTSPRFAVTEIQVSPTVHVSSSELARFAGVVPGDNLWALDTQAMARRVAAHPWVSSAGVERFPWGVRVHVQEREAVAAVALGVLYLADKAGRPFKQATMAEADGLPILTGLERAHYLEHPEASEAAFRLALGVLEEYRSGPDRPAACEVNIDPHFGFSLFLLNGGAQIKLGQGDLPQKLRRFDKILSALREPGAPGVQALRTMHLDGTVENRVPVRLL
jgi:cell division protein FtsQ